MRLRLLKYAPLANRMRSLMRTKAPSVGPRAGARSGMASPLRAGFADDDRGQMLILAGVILVLGFVIVGSTLIQLQNVGEETARLQRESLVDEFTTMLATFNETLGDATAVGNVNVEDFAARLDKVEQDVRVLTTKRGLVLEAERDGSPAAEQEAGVARPSRCANRLDNVDGIVTGVENESRRASIVGVVYRVWITDGQETIQDTVYFRFYPCVVERLYTPLDRFLDSQSMLGTEPPTGFSADPQTNGFAAPGGPVVTVTEYGAGGGPVATYRFAVNDVPSNNNWSQPLKIKGAGNGQYADTSSASNSMLLEFDDPAFVPGSTINSVKLYLRGYVDPLGVGDTFNVTPVLGGVDGIAHTLVPVATPTDISYDITNRRPGGGAWTTADLTNLQVRLKGVDNGVPPTGAWYADNATLAVRAQTTLVYNGHGVFQRTGLPDYDRHWLLMNVTTGSDETVRLDIYNWSLGGGSGDWEPWNAHVSGNGSIPAPGAGPEILRRLYEDYQISSSDIVRVRVFFTAADDTIGASSLIVDELRIKSVLD